MNKKTSAHYQREFRKRLREQGLIKKEVWVLPENVKRLSAFEKELRLAEGAPTVIGVRPMTKNNLWTTKTIFNALGEQELFAGSNATLELIEGAEPSIHITMHEYGDLPLFMSVAGDQILVEAMMWPADIVSDTAEFNDLVLRTHKLFPLSTICLDRMPDGKDYYQMFGALSAFSNIEEVVIEIEMLADNVIKITEAYGAYINENLDDAAV